MGSLPPADFEGLLHPVFQEDEFKLIILGGILGVLVGFAQYYGIDVNLNSINTTLI